MKVGIQLPEMEWEAPAGAVVALAGPAEPGVGGVRTVSMVRAAKGCTRLPGSRSTGTVAAYSCPHHRRGSKRGSR